MRIFYYLEVCLVLLVVLSCDRSEFDRIPAIQIDNVYNVTNNSVNLSVNLIELREEMVSFGMCHDTIPGPTLLRGGCSYMIMPRPEVVYESWAGGLESDTKYYIRAYANTLKNGRVYSNEVEVTTLSE